MNRTIGNLLLTLGTILASLAAANSERASRWLDLAGEAHAGEYLFAGVEDLAPGTELDASTTKRLRDAGRERVLVRTPPTNSMRIATDDADQLIGKVLAAEAKSMEGEMTFAADTYVDDTLRSELLDAGIAHVEVKRTKKFAFGAWGHKWMFLLGALCMLGGIVMKRSARDEPVAEAAVEGGSTAGPAALLAALIAELEGLVGRAGTLEGEALKLAIDPLLEERVPELVELRYDVQRRHGAKVFASVFGPFANGERKLSRAWSATVDGAPEEARDSLELSLHYFRAAQAELPAQ